MGRKCEALPPLRFTNNTCILKPGANRMKRVVFRFQSIVGNNIIIAPCCKRTLRFLRNLYSAPSLIVRCGYEKKRELRPASIGRRRSAPAGSRATHQSILQLRIGIPATEESLRAASHRINFCQTAYAAPPAKNLVFCARTAKLSSHERSSVPAKVQRPCHRSCRRCNQTKLLNSCKFLLIATHGTIIHCI